VSKIDYSQLINSPDKKSPNKTTPLRQKSEIENVIVNSSITEEPVLEPLEEDLKLAPVFARKGRKNIIKEKEKTEK
jgi:hypothetical protein